LATREPNEAWAGARQRRLQVYRKRHTGLRCRQSRWHVQVDRIQFFLLGTKRHKIMAPFDKS
jgi:hypothetical protein